MQTQESYPVLTSPPRLHLGHPLQTTSILSSETPLEALEIIRRFLARSLLIPSSRNGEMRDVPLNATALSALDELRKRSDGSAL